MYLDVSYTPISNGWGPGAHKIFGPSAYAHTVRETAKFCTVIKLDLRKIFAGSTTNADARSVCGS